VSLPTYFDVNMSWHALRGLRSRGLDVLSAQEDGRRRLADPGLLDRAMELNRLFVTADEDFLKEAARRLQQSIPFPSIIYGHQASVTVRQYIEGIEYICNVGVDADLRGEIIHLPI
jgi:predicted nuclease of predicted toxin-antitoxin system